MIAGRKEFETQLSQSQIHGQMIQIQPDGVIFDAGQGAQAQPQLYLRQASGDTVLRKKHPSGAAGVAEEFYLKSRSEAKPMLKTHLRHDRAAFA